MAEPIHYSSSILKFDAKGRRVISSTLGPGERLVSGETFEDLTSGKVALIAPEAGAVAPLPAPVPAESAPTIVEEFANADTTGEQEPVGDADLDNTDSE